MEITAEEKIKKVVDVIEESIKINPPIGGIVIIPEFKFMEKKITPYDIGSTLMGLLKKGAVKSYEVLWGYINYGGGVIITSGMPEELNKDSYNIYQISLDEKNFKTAKFLSFPKDLRWEEITISFLNSHEAIIKFRKETLQTNYDVMGFKDKKRKLPNKQWELLVELSKRNSEMSWQNNKNLPQKEIDAFKKRKQILSDTLKTYFQIQNDPFSDYVKNKMYKIKINLIPENSRLDDEQRDDLGLKEYLAKEAPQINDQP